MKTMKFTNVLFCSILTAALCFSCSKDGDQGPIGLQGEQGIAGQDGADGEQGIQGETGTANVIYSDWIASEFGSITAAPESQQLLATLGPGDFNDTEDVLLVYGRRNNSAISGDILQLPFELFSQSEVYRYRLSKGSGFIALRAEGASSDGGNKLYTYFDEYRYIIIPGGTSTSGKSESIDYGKMSYSQLTAYFNIPE